MCCWTLAVIQRWNTLQKPSNILANWLRYSNCLIFRWIWNCEPTRATQKKHKVMAFYFTLGNFHSTCKSQKSSLFLLALCRSVYIQKYGFSKIAMHFNEEMHVLETSGITVDGHPHNMCGSLTFIAGDNLNSHMIGGFNASFSPNVLYPCRFCETTNSEMQEIVSVDEMCLRTRQSYDQHASASDANASQLSCFGIRFRSSFIMLLTACHPILCMTVLKEASRLKCLLF